MGNNKKNSEKKDKVEKEHNSNGGERRRWSTKRINEAEREACSIIKGLEAARGVVKGHHEQ